MPGYFKEYGQYTQSIGRLFDRVDDNSYAWSEPAIRYQRIYLWTDYKDAYSKELDNIYGLWQVCEKLAVHDTTYFDGKIPDRGIEALQRFAQSDTAFFLGCWFC